MPSPSIIVAPELPSFDAADLDAVTNAFQRAPACPLRQSWRPDPESGFVPATVRAGWRESSLLVFGDLTDITIFTHATRSNERLWELGDVLEIFLRPVEQAAYSEFQIAPNNLQLHLRYASPAAFQRAQQSNSIAEALVQDPGFKSRAWTRPEMSSWCVLAEIPAAAVCDCPKPMTGSAWHFSFCRYDYTSGRAEPVISSSSALSRPNFHCLSEWGVMQFQS